MRPIFYEMKKTATNWKIIVVVGVLVLFTVLLFYSSINSSNSAGSYVYESSALFQDNGTYYLDTFVYNGYGAPAKDIPLEITLGLTNYTEKTTSHLKIWDTSSNAAGYANITFPSSLTPTVQYTSSYYLSVNTSGGYFYSGSYISFNGNSSSSSNGGQYPNSGVSYSIQTVANSRNQYVNNIMIQYLSYSGNRSQPINLYYYYPNVTTYYLPTQSINSSFVKVGTYSNFNSLIIKPQLDGSRSYVMVAITYSGSNQILSFITMNYEKPDAATFENIYFSGPATISIFMLSIAGVVGGYVAFGKDRVTGVLDNVLARPIRRSNIILSRYTASASIIVTMSFAVGVIDYLLISFQYGILLPVEFLLMVGGGLAVTSIAFLGLTFLFSNLTKSSGNLIAVSILLLVFYIFAWQILQYLIPLALYHGFDYALTVRLELLFSMLSPLNFSNLTYYMLSPANYSFSPIATVTFNSVGLNWYSLGIYGALWILLPILGAFYLYRTRD